MSDIEAWREWFAKAVQPGLDARPILAAPCPSCGSTYGEDGATCGYCFICHGRDNCGCDRKHAGEKR